MTRGRGLVDRATTMTLLDFAVVAFTLTAFATSLLYFDVLRFVRQELMATDLDYIGGIKSYLELGTFRIYAAVGLIVHIALVGAYLALKWNHGALGKVSDIARMGIVLALSVLYLPGLVANITYGDGQLGGGTMDAHVDALLGIASSLARFDMQDANNSTIPSLAAIGLFSALIAATNLVSWPRSRKPLNFSKIV